ncbi:hypothetical protein AVEN_115454-1 [Araneus ventricosus]|uniref:Uncharacterized protein n=1 Tax=Araneus ventricosus TaxID=182803 RepID=A0A4Y2WMY3_ARAVE|nr:hypothetical protein AVEN_115454-1 [Araneus ventricosus]
MGSVEMRVLRKSHCPPNPPTCANRTNKARPSGIQRKRWKFHRNVWAIRVLVVIGLNGRLGLFSIERVNQQKSVPRRNIGQCGAVFVFYMFAAKIPHCVSRRKKAQLPRPSGSNLRAFALRTVYDTQEVNVPSSFHVPLALAFDEVF